MASINNEFKTVNYLQCDHVREGERETNKDTESLRKRETRTICPLHEL